MLRDAAQPSLYNHQRWGGGYVQVAENGELLVCPTRDAQHSIRVTQLVEQIRAIGLRTPVLVRCRDILHDRVNCLVNTFNEACEQLEYQGRYQVVYPIKVNQQRRVVEEIVHTQPARSNGQVGLEAGSKPELLAVLAMALEPGATIVCNGYKDRDYVRMALMGQALGYRVFIVAEKVSEIPIILEEAEKLKLSPCIGVRARLATIGKGHWQNTGGEKSKFGLSSQQLLDAIALLRQHKRLDCLRLLHFHLGSQIANIRDIHKGLQECARIYGELRAQACPIDTVDIGGGLGVDYDGTGSRNICSINYQLSDYALNVVQAFKEECQLNDLPHPHLISESGRALTAHHAILITDVVAREVPHATTPAKPENEEAISPLSHLWRDFQALEQGASNRSLNEIFYDAAHAMEEALAMFYQGSMGLVQKAQAEQLFLAICERLRTVLDPQHRDHREIIDELNSKLAEKLFVNFSLFQSLPDVWGIDQIFPIMPIQHLDKPLTRRAVVQDITCDSDGR
ncbi:MAG: biosynthetic arginine decarboxylase, partial [Oleiphilaceae bacterium]|nr:biosynthetic arginine decarboxylase [Oleiphilaceae bacterium]